MLLLATQRLLSTLVISFCNILSEIFLLNISKRTNSERQGRTADGWTLALFQTQYQLRHLLGMVILFG
jgi:hypothetical protein